MKELIEKLQALTKPDRGVDYEIERLYFGHAAHGQVPRYTESISDALKLLPRGWGRSVDATLPDAGIDVRVYPPGPHKDGKLINGDHMLESVATLIAVVKASEEQMRLGTKDLEEWILELANKEAVKE